jgi:hypothetical protein
MRDSCQKPQVTLYSVMSIFKTVTLQPQHTPFKIREYGKITPPVKLYTKGKDHHG